MPEMPSDPDALAKLLGAAGLHYDPAADTGPPIGPPAPPVAPPKFALPADVAARTATQDAQADTIGPTTVRPPVAPPPGPQVFAKQPAAAGAAPVVQGGGGPSAGPYLKSLQDQQAAADRAGGIEAGMVEDQGLIQGRQAELLQRQQNEMAQAQAARDAQAQAKLAEVDAASKDAASAKQDPDRWWHSQGPLDKARLTLASFLGGFGAALTHTQDGVAASIDKHITDDINAQRGEIEAKHGRVADLKGSLAEMYRRFGDMQQAEAGARILQLQHLDAEAAQYGATAKSALVRANAAQAHAQLQSEIEKQKMKLAQGARALTPLEQAQLDKTRAETGKTLAETDKLKSGAAAEAPPDAPEMSYAEAVKSYLFPGSDAGLKRAQQEQHDIGAAGVIHKNVGLKGEAAIEGAKPYSASPFMPNALIRQHNEALHKNFGKGAAPGEPLPADFEEDDKP